MSSTAARSPISRIVRGKPRRPHRDSVSLCLETEDQHEFWQVDADLWSAHATPPAACIVSNMSE